MFLRVLQAYGRSFGPLGVRSWLARGVVERGLSVERYAPAFARISRRVTPKMNNFAIILQRPSDIEVQRGCVTLQAPVNCYIATSAQAPAGSTASETLTC